MNTSLYTATIPVFKKGLSALDGVLDKAAAFAAEKGMSEQDLLAKNLIGDMFPLSRQVQAACDQSKFFPFRLNGQRPPAFEDTETTIAQLKERIQKTIAVLDGVKPDDVDGKDGVQVRLPYFKDMHLSGYDYAFEYILPNFFFHCTVAYGILRAQGVPLGKMDFIGGLNLVPDAPAE